MKQLKTMIFLIVFAGLIASAVLVGRSRPAAAFSVGSSSQIGVVVSTPSTEEANQKEQLSKEIQELFFVKERELLKPGWLHIVYKTSLRKDVDRGFLTDGVSFPSEYVIEDWYLLDEESYAVKAVTFMRDLDENILQKSVFFDGTWLHTTLNDNMVTGAFKPLIDGGYMTMVLASDTTLEKIDPSDINSNQGLTVYEIRAASPDGSSEIFATRLYFDGNGNLVKAVSVLVYKDGTEVIDSETEFLLMENVADPSDAVIEYLAEVKK
ncbi:MAG: hypothetical protein HXY38_06730 [Chloroflexi bacterium]|nr:hypothetical protein [Chloroflexota bacterium]